MTVTSARRPSTAGSTSRARASTRSPSGVGRVPRESEDREVLEYRDAAFGLEWRYRHRCTVGAASGQHAGCIGGRTSVARQDHGCHARERSGTSLGRVIVDSALYRRGVRVRVDLPTDDVAGLHAMSGDKGDFVWVGLHEPAAEELDRVAEVFDLHPLAVEDALHAHQRPKLERYDDGLFLVLKTLWYVDELDAVETGEINLFLGRDFVVSVRHGEGTDLGSARRAMIDHRGTSRMVKFVSYRCPAILPRIFLVSDRSRRVFNLASFIIEDVVSTR